MGHHMVRWTVMIGFLEKGLNLISQFFEIDEIVRSYIISKRIFLKQYIKKYLTVGRIRGRVIGISNKEYFYKKMKKYK